MTTLLVEDRTFTMSHDCLLDLMSGIQYEVEERALEHVYNLDIHVYVNDEGRFETVVQYTEMRHMEVSA